MSLRYDLQPGEYYEPWKHSRLTQEHQKQLEKRDRALLRELEREKARKPESEPQSRPVVQLHRDSFAARVLRALFKLNAPVAVADLTRSMKWRAVPIITALQNQLAAGNVAVAGKIAHGHNLYALTDEGLVAALSVGADPAKQMAPGTYQRVKDTPGLRAARSGWKADSVAYAIARVLHREGPQNSTGLKLITGLSHYQMSGNVAVQIRNGFFTKAPDPANPARMIYSLTKAGERRLAAVQPAA